MNQLLSGARREGPEAGPDKMSNNWKHCVTPAAVISRRPFLYLWFVCALLCRMFWLHHCSVVALRGEKFLIIRIFFVCVLGFVGLGMKGTQSLFPVSQWGPPAGSFLLRPELGVYDLAHEVRNGQDQGTTRDFSFIILCAVCGICIISSVVSEKRHEWKGHAAPTSSS